jgi:hypothetical protein
MQTPSRLTHASVLANRLDQWFRTFFDGAVQGSVALLLSAKIEAILSERLEYTPGELQTLFDPGSFAAYQEAVNPDAEASGQLAHEHEPDDRHSSEEDDEVDESFKT